jgi:hypothetical protein
MTSTSAFLHLCIFGLVVTKYASTEQAGSSKFLLEEARSCTEKQISDLDGNEVGDFLQCAAKTCRRMVLSDEISTMIDSSLFINHELLGTDLVGMMPAELRELIGLPTHLAECVAQTIAMPAGNTTPGSSMHDSSTLSGQCEGPPGRCKEQRELENQSGGLFWTREHDGELDAESTRHAGSALVTIVFPIPASASPAPLRSPHPPLCRTAMA